MSQPLRKEFEAIQSRWQELCRNGHLPTRADFPPESLTPWMGHIQIVERVNEGDQVRHRVRLVGTRIVYYEGRDNTGLFLDDVIPTDQRDEILEPYRRCADTRAPVYGAFYSCSEAAISSQLERLILPLATDGKTIDQFLVAIYRAGT
ncbi:PAS domain-containing protein [Dongia deserti]|uniref:PAS domain-containing protein n=1 Tax=Dongia deserti TaxID=2268030 RepID=UPI0013C41E59|nr:PAS domain-containing protein [Dongia deserti]